MLSLSSIVQVRVNVSSAPVSGSAFSAGLILAPTASEITGETRLRLFASAADLLAAGFAASDPAYLAAAAYFAASPAPDRVWIGLYSSNEDPADIFSQIRNQTSDFYGVCLCDPSVSAVRSFAEALAVLPGQFTVFCADTGTVAQALSDAHVLKKLYDLGSSRLLGVYGSDIYCAPALMGTAMGLSRAYPGEAFSLCYRQVPGMLPVSLTESEAASLKALNANVYLTRGAGRNLLENGSTASGMRFDEVLTLDRIASELQNAALEMLTSGSGRIPQTDEASAVFFNRFTSVLSACSEAGILATRRWRGSPVGNLQPGDMIPGGYLMWADPYDRQSDADRAAHKAMPIHVALCLSGSVETLLIDVDVTL